MRRIDDRTFELTDDETKLAEEFDELLDVGLGLNEAARNLWAAHPDTPAAFIAWLVDRV